MGFPFFGEKREKQPEFLEPTKELAQSLFDRVDISISFGPDYPGIPNDFSVSTAEKNLLRLVRFLNIKYRPYSEGGTEYDYELDSNNQALKEDIDEVIRSICKRLKIWSGLAVGTLGESEFDVSKRETP